MKERTDGGGEIKRRDWRGEVNAGWVKKKKTRGASALIMKREPVAASRGCTRQEWPKRLLQPSYKKQMNAGALKRRSSRYICCDGTREAGAEDAEVTSSASRVRIWQEFTFCTQKLTHSGHFYRLPPVRCTKFHSVWLQQLMYKLLFRKPDSS